MRPPIVFLLAGGKGTRLYPLTKHRAKPAVPFGGMWRLIDFTLSNCLHSGLTRICILTQHKSESLTRHVSHAWRSLGSPLGESIDFLAPKRKDSLELQGSNSVAPQRTHARSVYRGTADAVYQNMDTILREGACEVVIVCGDHVYAMDYRPFVAFHRERDADLTIAACPVPRSEAQRFGILEAREDGRVSSFVEKPKGLSTGAAGENGTVWASMGVYIFKTRTLLREGQERTNHGGAVDFGADVIPSLIDRERVFLYPFENGALGHTRYWRDVGTLDSYFQAHMDLLGPAPAFDLRKRSWPILHVPEQTCPCVFGDSIGGGAHNSIVAGGCRIDGDVSDSVISPHVTVEAGACVSRSILFPGVHIEAGARVRNAILDKNVRILRGTVLGDDADFPDTYGGKVAYTPGGIAVVAKGEVVGRVHHAIGDSPREALVLDHETRDDGLPVSPDARLPLCDAAPIAAR